MYIQIRQTERQNEMAFEKTALVEINKKFNEFGASAPNMHWEYGTLWADTNRGVDVDLIVEGLLDAIAPGYIVKTSKLEKTETEPWDQWAFDIAPDPSYKFEGWNPKVVA